EKKRRFSSTCSTSKSCRSGSRNGQSPRSSAASRPSSSRCRTTWLPVEASAVAVTSAPNVSPYTSSRIRLPVRQVIVQQCEESVAHFRVAPGIRQCCLKIAELVAAIIGRTGHAVCRHRMLLHQRGNRVGELDFI